MPNYDYRCSNCGKFTVYQGIKEKALDTCPTCGSPVNRVIGKNIGIVYKCAGFYTTDTRPSGDNGDKGGSVTEYKAVNE